MYSIKHIHVSDNATSIFTLSFCSRLHSVLSVWIFQRPVSDCFLAPLVLLLCAHLIRNKASGISHEQTEYLNSLCKLDCFQYSIISANNPDIYQDTSVRNPGVRANFMVCDQTGTHALKVPARRI